MSDGDSIYDAPLEAAEFHRRAEEAILAVSGPEGDELREQIAWFLRRYPTPLERLRYARRKYHEAEALRGIARRAG